MVLGLRLGDVVRMKKAHPCGGSLWNVTRLGADIGMVCQECGRYVMLSRSQLARRLRTVMPGENAPMSDGK